MKLHHIHASHKINLKGYLNRSLLPLTVLCCSLYLRSLDLPERVGHAVDGLPLGRDAVVDDAQLLVEGPLGLLQLGDLVDQVLLGVGTAGKGGLEMVDCLLTKKF